MPDSFQGETVYETKTYAGGGHQDRVGHDKQLLSGLNT